MPFTTTKPLFKLPVLFICLLLALLSCQKPNDPPAPPAPPVLSSEKSITTFSFTVTDNPGLTAAVAGVITTDTIRVLFPNGTTLAALKPTISFTGKTVSPASKLTQNFTSTLPYTVTAEDGSTKKYFVLATTAGTWLDSANIYIAGKENGYVYYWKNGTKINLGTTTAGNGTANAVAVVDTDVYVVGKIGFTAKLWKMAC